MNLPSRYFCLSTAIFLLASFAFAADTTVQWGYTGKTAPQDWGKLSPSFVTCAQGQVQSPIDIPSTGVNSVPYALAIHYQRAPMIIMDQGYLAPDESTQSIENKGHGIQLNFVSTGEWISFAGQKYQLQQFHIHTPSENEINGKTYPLEIHFVHSNTKGQGLVIAVFVKEGPANPALQNLINHFPKKLGVPVLIKGQYVNPYNLLPNNYSYYSFMGSLTTPPCAEGIQWVVLSTPITASAAQIKAFTRAADGHNARPVQPVNGRAVFYSQD